MSWHWSWAVHWTGVPATQAPVPLHVSPPLQALVSAHEVPAATLLCEQVPLALQVSVVQGLLSLQLAAVHPGAKPSWKVRVEPVTKSRSRARKAPVPTNPVPAVRVPFGTRTSALMVLPVPNAAALGVAVMLPLVPLMPEISMRIPFAVSVTPDAGPM